MDRDPLVTRYVTVPWSDAGGHRAFVVDRMQTAYPKGLGYWSVIDAVNDTGFMGWILLLPCSGDRHEIGWRFKRDCWGSGYATEAARPVLRHALDNVGLKSVVAEIHPDNGGSMRVAEKIGFRFVENRIIGGDPAACYQFDANDRQSSNHLQS